MLLRLEIILFVFFLIGSESCRMHLLTSELATNAEIVMHEGMVVRAITSIGDVEIEAGEGFKRTYRWGNGCERSVDMWPRKERWYGSLGLYYPGPAGHWDKCGEVSCGVLEEAQMHFASEVEAEKWIEERFLSTKDYIILNGGTKVDCVFNNAGLVFIFGIVPRSEMLIVEVWQIMINGNRPMHLNGAKDEKIMVSR